MPDKKPFPHILLLLLVCIVAAPHCVLAATIIDDEGRSLTFDQPYTRIVSLYPAHTENLASMGCDTQLIGIGDADNYPEHIRTKPRFSYRDNIEKFLAAAPDLVLIRPMISRSQPELIERLRHSGISVVSLQPTSISGMFSYWQQLGQLCGSEARATAMVEEFNRTVAELQQALPENMEERPRVYFESIHDKMKTFDPEAISIYALQVGGGRNIAMDASGRNDSNIAVYGKERLLSRAEEIDVFLSQVGRMNRVTLTDIYNEPGFQLIKAVRTRSVYLIEEEIVSRPTMRLLTGIRKIRSFLYPARSQSPDTGSGNPTHPNPQLTRR